MYEEFDDLDYGFEEEDLLTNFTEGKLQKYQKAISIYANRYSDTSLYIDDKAYNSRGRKLEGYYALRTTEPYKMRSEFWDIFNSI